MTNVNGEDDDARVSGQSGVSTRRPVHIYTAFGLTIESEFFISELEPQASRAAPDIVLVSGIVDRPQPEYPIIRVSEFGENEAYLGWSRIGKYKVSGTHSVTFETCPGYGPEFIGFTFLGAVMAVVCHFRKLATLHGSAIDFDGRGAIFIGDKGAGKSTMAGAMIGAGHRLLSDDVVALHLGASGYEIVPSYPMVKLTKVSVASFGEARFEVIPTDIPDFDKLRARVAGTFDQTPVTARCIYVLEPGDTPEIIPMAPREAYAALLRYCYMIRFGDATGAYRIAPAIMQMCADVARTVRVARLIVPRKLERLPSVESLVRSDLA